MSSFNKVILMGNVTRDPQLSYLPSNTAVMEFGLATNHTYKKQDGSQGEEVCFVDCKIFGKRAEVINKYVKKGDPILVEGRLKFDQWQAQDGSKRSKISVMIENFEFIGGTKPQSEPQQDDQPPSQFDENNELKGVTDNPPFNPTDDIPF
jgi:single-strand DNA-binding protein